MKAVAYIRVSTEEQAKEGTSLDNKVERIQGYCEYKGFDLADILRDEGVSGGKNKNREGFERILERIKQNGFDAIVVYSLDRLSRDMLTLLSFERLLNESDIELHTIEGQIDTSTPDGFMSYAMRAFVGEMERRQTKYRTKQALQHKKQKSEVVGKIPYGYKRDGDALVEDPEEHRTKKMANRLYSRGKTVSDVVSALNKKGMKTRTGQKWQSIQVQRMLDEYDSVYQKTSKLSERIQEFILAIA